MQSQIPHLVVEVTNVLEPVYQVLLFMSIYFLGIELGFAEKGYVGR
jgi:hypothetical protein